MACKGWRPRNLPELKHADNTYPDMLVERQGEKRWVDVKSKSGTSHYRRGGYDVTGFPLSHWRRYHNIQMRTGTPVWIFFMHRQEGEVRATSISRLESAISHIWADGNMIYFKIAGIPQLASYREIMERRGAEGDIHD
ncbi:MAG: hypothetical protein KatS3mg038_1027 [Candidatus Kapaibacterium sp.]|nr:MAG: hypothetical protein KatS3mg038_1027 [Candidatus Kapabacteria bacterium]